MLDEDAVEDVLQESYIAVYQHIGDYKTGNFQGWVDTIVANRAKNYLRKKNPILFSDMETEESPLVEFEDDKIEFRPDETIDYNETKRLVMQIVDGLSAEQRLATILFYFEERSVKEIAEICECSENTVKSRLNYARKKIKEDVLALEKKGTKLYSISAIPFLIWMLSEEAKTCVVSEATTKAVVKEVVAEVAKATASAATKTVVAKAGMAIGTKIAIAVTTAIVTVGSVVAGIAIVQNNEDKEVVQDTDADAESQEQQIPQTYEITVVKKETRYTKDSSFENAMPDMKITYHYNENGYKVSADWTDSYNYEGVFGEYKYDAQWRMIESDEVGFHYFYEYNEKGQLSKTIESAESYRYIIHEYETITVTR